MAHVLDIVAATTINLASGSCALLDYTPKAPTSTDDDATVTESAKVQISGASVSAIQTIIQSINKAFRFAEIFHEKRIGSPAYVQLTPDGYSDVYRSEIFTGRIEWGPKVLDEQWVELKVDAIITWIRRYYWEGPQISLTLTNTGGSGQILAVVNHDDATAGHDNYVEIAADDVAGDLPTPPIITLTNTYASGSLLDVYLAHNFMSTPQYLINTVEAENATGGTPIADAACSNGYYNNVSWTALTETQLLTFPLGDADTEYALGNFFKIMLRFQTAPNYTNCWIRWKALFGSTVVWSGPLILLNNKSLQDTGIMQWPPGGDLPLNMSGLNLVLYAKRNTSGTHNLKIDFVQLLCMDGARVLKGTVAVAQNERLVDNGVLQKIYKASQGNLAYHTHAAIGPTLMLRPGYRQRLQFLQIQSDGAAPIERTMNVQVVYRPRRLTL